VQRGQPDEDDIERDYAAAHNLEDDLDSVDEESPNLDDPEELSIIMNEVQPWKKIEPKKTKKNSIKKNKQTKKQTKKEKKGKKKDKVKKGDPLGGTTMLLWAVQFRRSPPD
jgi:hypothetical protein